MNASAGSLSEMVNSSVVVLTKPSVASFERYERRGNLQSALFYVGVAAIISALIALVGGLIGGALSDTGSALGTGLREAIRSLLSTFVNFLLFSATTYYVGRAQGGTGTLDEVAYSFSLFIVPIQVLVALIGVVLTITIIGICLLPLLAIAGIVAYVFYAWLAVQSSMNLVDTTKTLITLGVAALVTIVGSSIIGAIFSI